MFKRSVSAFGLTLTMLFSSFFLYGCSSKPFLTQDCTYEIVYVSPSGQTQTDPVNLPWNTNMAVMQKVLLESSFVLSDLHTPNKSPATSALNKSPSATTSLLADFSEPRSMTFLVDQTNLTLNVKTIQIEVEGDDVGLVTINETIILQGINNPNLQPAFKQLVKMLHKQKSEIPPDTHS